MAEIERALQSRLQKCFSMRKSRMYYDPGFEQLSTDEREVMLTRLRDGGDYQEGDRVFAYGEEGDKRTYRLMEIGEDGLHVDFLPYEYEHDTHRVEQDIPAATLDRFTRGRRQDVCVALEEVFYNMTQQTVQYGPDQEAAWRDWREGGQYPPVELTSRIKSGLQEGIVAFFYGEPSDDSTLIHWLMQLEQMSSRQIASKADIEEIVLYDQDGDTFLRKDLSAKVFPSGVPVPEFMADIVATKYGSRVDAAQYALLVLLDIRQEESLAYTEAH